MEQIPPEYWMILSPSAAPKNQAENISQARVEMISAVRRCARDLRLLMGVAWRAGFMRPAEAAGEGIGGRPGEVARCRR